jgi:hypothetical protein
VLTCKSLFGLGYRGERLIEPSSTTTTSCEQQETLEYNKMKRGRADSTRDDDAGALSQSRLVIFLNGLPMAERKVFFQFVQRGMVVQHVVISPVPAHLQHYVRFNEAASDWDGADWLEFNTCHVVESGEGIDRSLGYPKFQCQWNMKQDEIEFTTPQKAPKGAGLPMLKRLKTDLSADSWAALKGMANASGGKKARIAFFLHHLAYAASDASEGNPIPTNVGAGSSVSHLCDNPKCCNSKHLVIASQHRQNTARINCRGVILLVKDGVIMRQIDCPHCVRDVEGTVMEPNCCKIHVEQLHGLKAEDDAAYQAKHSLYEAAVGACGG